MQLSKSEALFAEAQKYIPGGVNSPVRSFKSVGGTPPFIARGQGARVWDVDGNEYIDYLGSWGPLVLGHSHPAVVEVLKKTAEGGTSFGAPVEQEVELAKIICGALPSVESVRLVSSGTEACMSAIRLHRARQNHQVRRLLSRPRRWPLGQSRLRCVDPRHPHQRRCSRVLRQ
jgi:glutamate-1-semialdehyde 2,1-aminomutase